MIKCINYYMLIMLLISLPSMIYSSCTTPTSGERIWDVAAHALVIMCSIESKLSQLISEIEADFNGTFTVIDEITSVVCSSEMLAESISSNLDQLIISFDNTFVKLAAVESKTALLLTEVDQLSIDVLATFTALDALKNSIGSKLDVLANNLQSIESDVDLLIETEIDQQITVASHLNVLQTDVDLLNSALDSLTIVQGINQMNSFVAIISSLTDNIEININNLQDLLQTDFSGTWTALDAQLMLVCTIESLADNVNLVSMVDFSGVFTSLALLQQTIHEIDSMVDLTSIVNSKNLTCSIESKIDSALSKLSIAQQQLLPLPDLGQSIINLLASDVTILDSASSRLDITIELLLLIDSAVDTIISKVSVIESGLFNNSSSLEVISNNLFTIDSALDSFDATASKLEFIDSKLGTMNLEAFTIESLVDLINGQIFSIDSKIDVLQIVSKSELIASELATIGGSLITISSKLDLLIIDENIINSEVDIIIEEAASSLELLSTVGSKIDAIESKLDLSAGIALTSKLAVIEDKVCTISSKMVIVDSNIAGMIFTAEDLVTDFQETWTILDSISNLLAADQLGLQTISSKLSQLNLPVDLSGVYTVINSIIVQEVTVNTQVDTYNSLVDALARIIPIDFNGVFTALPQIQPGLITIESRVDILNSHVNTLETYLGIPIYNRDLGTTGYVISKAERYYVAEPLVYNPAAAGTSAIYISSSDVMLDLNEQTITQLNGLSGTANTKGIVAGAGWSNIRIANGGLIKLTSKGISFDSSCSNLLLTDLNVFNVGSTSGASPFVGDNGIDFNTGTSNVVVDNCTVRAGHDDAVMFLGTNILVKDCLFFEGAAAGVDLQSGGSNGVAQRCTALSQQLFISLNFINFVFESSIAEVNGGNVSPAISLFQTQKGVVKNCSCGTNKTAESVSGISINGSLCEIINNQCNNFTTGLRMPAGGEHVNNIILDNTFINNTTNVDEPNGGPNTYLGNFAFNPTAVGNPNNTNYRISGSSNITRKFITVSEKGSFGDYITGWHNINMLP